MHILKRHKFIRNMTLENYLHKRYSVSTTKTYLRDINQYLARKPKAKTANYADIINYLDIQRIKQNPASLHRILQSIKKYYNYLVATKQRADHPCELLKLRDHYRVDIQLQELFKAEELEILLDRKERYQILKNRNQLILSLLIYQGLTTGELIRLKTTDLNLENTEIRIPSSHRLNARTLALESKQILPAYKYLNEDRKALVNTAILDQLLITKRGAAENGEGISYLVGTMQPIFKSRKLNPQTIRQSVIANHLSSGKDLRWVQIFAGHKYPSSTERYRATNLDELKAAILKHHPLDQRK